MRMLTDNCQRSSSHSLIFYTISTNAHEQIQNGFCCCYRLHCTICKTARRCNASVLSRSWDQMFLLLPLAWLCKATRRCHAYMLPKGDISLLVAAHDLNVHGINTLPASVVMSSEIIQEKEKCWTSCCCCCFHWLGCARQQDFASLRQGRLLCLHQPGSWSRRAEC